jgi:hypothetical protein
VALGVTPERVARPLDLDQQRVRVEPLVPRRRLAAGDAPALVARAGVVEDGVVEVEQQHRGQPGGGAHATSGSQPP